jgi:hypothetical protein
LRQKLARFNVHEFSGLVVEILVEAKRRHTLLEAPYKHSNLIIAMLFNYLFTFQIPLLKIKAEGDQERKEEENNTTPEENEEDPLYDKVPSDEDYASVASESSEAAGKPKSKSSKQKSSLFVKVSTSSSPLHTPSSQNTLLVPSKANKSTTPSPSAACKLQHKVLTTNFDKPPQTLIQPSVASSTLVANAESALNSIIVSLNQFDYNNSLAISSPKAKSNGHTKHLELISPPSQITAYKPFINVPDIEELKSENELMKSMAS